MTKSFAMQFIAVYAAGRHSPHIPPDIFEGNVARRRINLAGATAVRRDMTELDQLLAKIRDLPPDPRLSSIDARVFDGLAVLAARPALPKAAFGMAFGIALSVGLVGAALPTPSAQASSLFPLGAPSALAPSTLLDGGHE
jgi:hypothetical protein